MTPPDERPRMQLKELLTRHARERVPLKGAWAIRTVDGAWGVWRVDGEWAERMCDARDSGDAARTWEERCRTMSGR